MTGPLHLSPAAQDAADRLRHRRAAQQHQQRLHAQREREAALKAARDQHQAPLGDRIHTALLLDGPATCTQLAERVEATPHATRKALLTLETHGRATHRMRDGKTRVWEAAIDHDPHATRIRRLQGTLRHRILTQLHDRGPLDTPTIKDLLPGEDAGRVTQALCDARRHLLVTGDPTRWTITPQGRQVVE